MLAMLKWEITKTVRRLGWICIGYLLLLCLLWVLPAGAGRIGWMQPLLLTSSTFLALGAFAGMLYPTWNMVSYFSKDSYFMERLTGVPYWKVMLAKLPAGAGELLFMMVAARAGEALMAKFCVASSQDVYKRQKYIRSPPYFLMVAASVTICIFGMPLSRLSISLKSFLSSFAISCTSAFAFPSEFKSGFSIYHSGSSCNETV